MIVSPEVSEQPRYSECPVCGNQMGSSSGLSEVNLRFLDERLVEGNLDESITLARIAWTNFPSLKLDANSKTLIADLLGAMQQQVNATLSPIDQLSKSILPLVDKLGNLSEKLPDNIRREFMETNKQLKEEMKAVKESADKSSEPIRKDIQLLSNTVTELIHKPLVKGTVAENSFEGAWQDTFVKDDVRKLGGAGKSDLIVIPYLTFSASKQGEKISVERKAGVQKYCGSHLTEAIRHTKNEGARYCMLVYDRQENLAELQKPIYIDSEDGIIIAITDVESGGWKTAREAFDVFQSMLPGNNRRMSNSLDIPAIQRTVEEMQKLNTDIEGLRKHNNSALKNCEKVKDLITELEKAIGLYRKRLKDLVCRPTSLAPSVSV